MAKNHLFRRLQIKVSPKGLHKSLTPDHWPLTPALSTTVEDSLQISPVFMQNKANFRKSQMNVTKVLTKDYEKKKLGEHGKNEPKTNPIKPNLLNAQMNVNKVLTRDYEKYRVFGSRQNKPNQSQFLYYWFCLLFIIATKC